MTSLLTDILCWIKQIGAMVLNSIIDGLNAVIVALAAAAHFVAGLMPAMPAAPTLPSPFNTVMGWIAWFWPVDTTVAALSFVVSAWLIWLGVSILLRWVRAI